MLNPSDFNLLKDELRQIYKIPENEQIKIDREINPFCLNFPNILKNTLYINSGNSRVIIFTDFEIVKLTNGVTNPNIYLKNIKHIKPGEKFLALSNVENYIKPNGSQFDSHKIIRLFLAIKHFKIYNFNTNTVDIILDYYNDDLEVQDCNRKI